jgi:4-hydroxy-3-methylbut-2-enyl diphosphate reductase
MMEVLTGEGIREVGDYRSETKLEVSKSTDADAVMVVRAHGISPERREYLKSLGMEFRDATCPDVGIIAGKVRMHARKGYATVIFGDPKHPEVIGLLGYAEGKGHVITSEAEIDALPDLGAQVCMVSQSTMFTDEFEKLAARLKARFAPTLVFDTICGATKDRQADIRELQKQGCQAIVVIGGRHSANTVKLAKLVEIHGLPCFHVETAAELDFAALARFGTVGVTAGASTPAFLIDEVCLQLEKAA